MALSQFEVRVSQPVTDTLNREVGVFLQWTIDRAQTTSYKVFVHIIDASGQLVAQDDSVPGLWLRSTTDWRSGETVIDFHLLRVTNAKPGTYTVLVGLYDENSGERLKQVDSNETPLDDKLTLSTLELK